MVNPTISNTMAVNRKDITNGHLFTYTNPQWCY